MPDSAIRMHSMLIEQERGWLMRRWVGLEIVLPSVEHTGIVDRQPKGYHSLYPMVWLTQKLDLTPEDMSTNK
jgi:hypothetical protein